MNGGIAKGKKSIWTGKTRLEKYAIIIMLAPVVSAI